jgi:hypothetical protein
VNCTAILLLAILALCFPSASAPALTAPGTLGCKPYTGFCQIVTETSGTDGQGHAAGTCEDGRTFANAHVAAYRVFAAQAKYHVTGCADGRTGIKRVKIGYRLN